MNNSRYDVFCLVMALLKFFEETASKKGLVLYKNQSWFLEPDPTEFQVADGIILLSWNGFVSKMLTPWGMLEFAAELMGDWSTVFRSLQRTVALREVEPIAGLDKYVPYGVLYNFGSGLVAPGLLRREFCQRPEQALLEWWELYLIYRRQTVRTPRLRVVATHA